MADNDTTNTRPRPLDLLWHRFLKRPYRLYLKDHGGDGPVIIMLHGLASSSANWDPMIPLLRDKYRCITIDLVGFGASPKPDWYQYTMEEHIRDINKTIKSLRIERPFILVGHSLGGLIATRYARLNPKDVSRLVLLSPPVYAPLDTIESRIAQQRTSMYLNAYRFLRTHPRVTFDNFLRLTRIIPQTKSLVLDRATWLPLIRSLEQCIENQTIIRDIEEVRAPVDVFYGIFDEVVIPYNVKNLARIRDVTLHPLNVTHMVGKKYAAEVAKELLGETKPKKSAKKLPRKSSDKTVQKPKQKTAKTTIQAQS
jgi:cis-3-alkyl-4-acyloxetan-2-one decarboxylase